ncbi:unnamed protein product, partial [marine sediment metagenome]
IIYGARSYKKNLVLTHYPRDVYAQKVTEKGVEDYKTGELEIDGFKQTSALVDVAVTTYVAEVSLPNHKGKVKVPSAKVTLSGLALEMEGRGLEPTLVELIVRVDSSVGSKLVNSYLTLMKLRDSCVVTIIKLMRIIR